MSAYIEDDVLAYRLAVGASEILKGVRNVGLLRGRILGDAGDALAQEWIARVLERATDCCRRKPRITVSAWTQSGCGLLTHSMARVSSLRGARTGQFMSLW